jgi:hypothetical protein
MKIIKHTCDYICSIVAPFMQKGRYIDFKNVISLERQIVIFTPNMMRLKITRFQIVDLYGVDFSTSSSLLKKFKILLITCLKKKYVSIWRFNMNFVLVDYRRHLALQCDKTNHIVILP